MDEIATLLEQDTKEKSRTAQGAKHRATRTGKVGKMRMPADFLGKEYSRSSKPVSFSVEDMLYTLQETPTIKQLLLERLETEYQNYKLAIERTMDAVFKVTEQALLAVQEQINSLQRELLQQKNLIQDLEYRQRTAPGGSPASGSGKPKRQGRKRSPLEMKEHVFGKMAQMEAGEQELTLENILHFFPGVTYYLYTLKLWSGIQEMLAEYHLCKSEQPNPGEITETAGVNNNAG